MPAITHELLKNMLFEKSMLLRRIRDQVILLEEETPFINYRSPYYVNAKRNLINSKFLCISDIHQLERDLEHYELENFEAGILYR